MEQYIPKSALVAEIEKRRNRNSKNKLNLAAAFEDNYLLSFLDTLEVKETVEIARKDELEYVKYQLDLRLPEILDYNGVKVERKDFINDFIKAIKDE